MLCSRNSVWRIEFEYKITVIWWVRNISHIFGKEDNLKLKIVREERKLRKICVVTLEEHVGYCVDEVCNKGLNSILILDCK